MVTSKSFLDKGFESPLYYNNLNIINMIKLKRLQIIPKDATLNEKRDIQFITTDVYVKEDQIASVVMHIRGKTIMDSWKDIATEEYLKKEGIHLCTLMCKNINNLANIIVDEQVLKLISENDE